MDGAVSGSAAAENREDKERDWATEGDDDVINKISDYYQFQAVADAERQKKVLEINIQQRIIEEEGAKNVSLINNEIKKAAEQNEADILKYKLEKVHSLFISEVSNDAIFVCWKSSGQ